MEGAQIFTCVQNKSARNLFKKEEGMFLKVEGTKISGKGNICNAEGRNGYQDEFSFSIQEISDIKEEDYPKIKRTVHEFVSDYAHKDSETTDKQFLVKKFSGYSKLFKDAEEIEKIKARKKKKKINQ